MLIPKIEIIWAQDTVYIVAPFSIRAKSYKEIYEAVNSIWNTCKNIIAVESIDQVYKNGKV